MASSTAQNVLFDVQGPRARRVTLILNLVGVLLVAALAWVVLGKLAEQGQLDAAKWTSLFTGRTWENFLLPGLWQTLRAALLAVVLSIVFGLVFGLGRLSQLAPVRFVSTVVVEFFRAVPVLVMMIFFYLGLGRADLVEPSNVPFWAVVLGLMFYNGAVIAELIRSGVHQLPKGQREAALAIGLTPARSLRMVELPQALTAMLPSMVSQFVVILKDTALGYIITYPELLASARRLGSGDGNILQALFVAALVFVVINYLLSVLAAWLSRFLSYRTAGRTKPSEGPLAGEDAA
ncbi:glutamate ABC transporter permease [Kocuria dechangensis]|uniref:Glutamate ABC transporter permease n=1 Tax=Kocuria dechangensis TaxID=1176249 RepID=A0A917GKR9_9MICC|nr:amino acid ABC transporter permease [Kocuria dechangensis]GGG50328.1 glutamate ABC transporter permease [Kocuria dechangensis]